MSESDTAAPTGEMAEQGAVPEEGADEDELSAAGAGSVELVAAPRALDG
jgi:hypothetical protein